MSELSFEELLGGCVSSAEHLELRDLYIADSPAYRAWCDGQKVDGAKEYEDWFDLVKETVARGVQVRRVRVINEPVSDYIKFEHSITTSLNIAAGERVRWLVRQAAEGLLLPANDLWILDGTRVRFGFFSADGDYLGSKIVDDAEVVDACVRSFEDAWTRGTDHEDYTPR
ncbi:MAG TPA: hypothetical protein VGX23_19020 [Actinocrinis sp.]|nr:hypothetical protein [Actinocrinis sp.]